MTPVPLRTRQIRDADMELAQDQSKISELVRKLESTVYTVRLDPLGFDRHHNRYWWLGDDGADKTGERLKNPPIICPHSFRNQYQTSFGGLPMA